jgi:hypothetical protein
MNFSWPPRVAGKSPRRGARVWLAGATVVATAGAVAMAVPAMSAMASTHTAHATTTKMSGVSGYVGKELKLAAKVTGSSPTGWVKFLYGGKKLCSAPLSKGAMSCDHAFGTVGSYRVEAYYEGNSTHKASSSLATVKVLAWNTTTTVTTTSADPTAGKDVTITATVKSSSPATGSVTFKDAGGTLGTETLVNGKASLTYAWKAAGTYNVTATYKSNNTTHLGSTGTDSVVVGAATLNPTTVKFTNLGEINTTPFGTYTQVVDVTVTDNVAGGPAPTGDVEIIAPPPPYITQVAGVQFTGCTVAAGTPIVLTPVAGTDYSTGTCTVSTPTGAWGFVEIQANYDGDAANAPSSTGDNETKIINLMPTTTTVTPATATAGTVDLVATVVAAAGPTDNILNAYSQTLPDLVNFTITQDGTQVAACTGVDLGPAPTDPATNNGPNTADCDPTLAAGTYTVQATFSGDEYANGSSDTITLTVDAAAG